MVVTRPISTHNLNASAIWYVRAVAGVGMGVTLLVLRL
jgi:hypothetical protein